MRIFALFNLKPGVSHDDYLNFARTVDLPTVNGLGSIDRFEVFRTTGQLGSDAPPPYSYIEVLDINDMDQFGRDVATPVMEKVAAQFQAMADVVFLTTDRVDQ
jgi:hypothetical protein